MTRVLDEHQAGALARGGMQFRSTVTVVAERLTDAHDWHSAAGSKLRGRAGDWLLDDGTDSWTVADDVFTATYSEDSGGRWRKHATVHAVQVDEVVDVETREGIARAKPGDWLVCGAGAGTWPVDAEIFARRYAVTDA